MSLPSRLLILLIYHLLLQASKMMEEDSFLDDIAADKDMSRSDAVGGSSRKDR